MLIEYVVNDLEAQSHRNLAQEQELRKKQNLLQSNSTSYPGWSEHIENTRESEEPQKRLIFLEALALIDRNMLKSIKTIQVGHGSTGDKLVDSDKLYEEAERLVK
eukprot:Clim_evm2s21 gene=Clim_evmTU2s21